MFKNIKEAVFETLLAFNRSRAQIEAMMKLDFKIGNHRTQQLQLCFSNLASWPLFLIIAVLHLDPTRYSWSLQKSLFNYPTQAYFLLDGRLVNMVIFFILFYFIQWIIRSELFLTSVVFYFLLKSDIHLHLALSAILGIDLAKNCYLWWMHKDIKSKSFLIWKNFSTLQICGSIFGGLLSLFLLQAVSTLGYFSETASANRVGFLAGIVGLNLILQFVLALVWGAIYFKPISIEPSDLPINYSTANWILRFSIRPYFKKQLKVHIEKYLTLHQNNLSDLQVIKDLGPASIPYKISEIIKTELGYLQLASSRLTID